MKQISNKFQQGTLTILIAGNAFKLEQVGPAFSIFNPCPSLPSVATDDREQFQCLNIVLNDSKKKDSKWRDIAPLNKVFFVSCL